MNEIDWRFPNSNYGEENGFERADTEIFSKSPLESLAREVCQNSIDANLRSHNKYNVQPVVVEFSTFEVSATDFPGYYNFNNYLTRAKTYWEAKTVKNEGVINRLDNMISLLKGDKILNLRISDFNTVGLDGVYSNDKTKSFHMLTKGSGHSFKSSTSGGSKGIGKNAPFVSSTLRTVIYSTLNISDEFGLMGVTKLCSTNVDPFDESNSNNKDDITKGDGYYANSKKNLPIKESFQIDPNFIRKPGEYGTDLYLMGFNGELDWEKVVIGKILESFIVAIYKEQLVIKINEWILDKDSLSNFIESDFLNYQKKIVQRSIYSQFKLLTDSNTYLEYIDMGELGEVEFRFLLLNDTDKDFATKRTTYVRYPYMRIKESNSKKNAYPIAVLVTIEDNKLNALFRKFENPEHTDWNFSRNDRQDEGVIAKEAYNSLNNKIKALIDERLFSGNTDSTDFSGAEDLLPDKYSEIQGNQVNSIDEEAILTNIKKVNDYSQIGYMESENLESIIPDLGGSGELEEEAFVPDDFNLGDDGNYHPAENQEQNSNGDNIVFSKSKVEGIKFNLVVINESIGKYQVVIRHTEKLDDCELVIYLLDDSLNKIPIVVTHAAQENKALKVEKNRVFGVNIIENLTTVIELITDQNEMFSGEVIAYASR